MSILQRLIGVKNKTKAKFLRVGTQSVKIEVYK